MSILRRRSASRFGSLRFWCSGPCHRTNWLRVDSMNRDDELARTLDHF